MSQRAGSTIQGIPSSLGSRPVKEAQKFEKCPAGMGGGSSVVKTLDYSEGHEIKS